ncbi:MAG TPA: DUF2924 domain-containing protein [Planctomycetota bacterium]|nr:DUF2924 domain-containing protein [Planctomycetota bacterium]
MSTIAQQIRELQSLPAAQLAERYEALFGKPPRVRNRAWLFRQCAWQLQARELGGLSNRAKTRIDELVAQVVLPLGQAPPPKPRVVPRPEVNEPMVGTTLTRQWRGQTIRVEVRDGGYEWNGTLHKSLSAVAKSITGAAWNGKLFFGLTKRRAGA